MTNIVQVDSTETSQCEHCDGHIDGEGDFAGALNHYIDKHGYKLIHIGTLTYDRPKSRHLMRPPANVDSALCYKTVATLQFED